MPTSLLRPDTAQIWRRVKTGKSNSGEDVYTKTVLQTVPILLDPMPAGSRMGGDLQVMVEDVVYLQTHEGFIDGLMPSRFPAGAAPGDTFTIGGVAFTIAPNFAGAYPDITAGDKVIDQNARSMLVLAVATYYNVKPTLQLRLALGRAW